MNGPIVESASWIHEFQLTIMTSGLPSPYFTGVCLGCCNIGDASAASPCTIWLVAGSCTGTIGVGSPVSGASGVRYVFTSWSDGSTSNPHASATVNAPLTLTANYETQYQVTFTQTGVSCDFKGTVLTVDGVSYSEAQLSVSLWFNAGSTHSFAYQSPLVVTANAKRYVWASTSGLSKGQSSSSLMINGPGSVTAAYTTQYYLTVQVSPSSAGTASPLSGWYSAGATVSISVKANAGYTFQRWIGTGLGSYSGTKEATSITMNGAITETADLTKS
jgi:hypothetical protein